MARTNLADADPHRTELARGERFDFGGNWTYFLETIDEHRIAAAEESLRTMLECENLEGRSFLDVGSGSGLFSLAARRLGAEVVSFDYDPRSVACTRELAARYRPGDGGWRIERGSVLDTEYLARLGTFDVVYSWGVLHHTGAQWTALGHVDGNVAAGGKLCIALYNRQPAASAYWLAVKKGYNRFPAIRPLLIGIHLAYPFLPSVILRKLQGRTLERGMNAWRDLIDWLGGYPFEVSRPEEVLEFYRRRGYALVKLKTVAGRMGCNEYVFEKTTTAPRTPSPRRNPPAS